MDYSPPGSSLWDFPGKNIGVGCHFPTPVDLPDPGIEPEGPVAPVLQTDSLPPSLQGSTNATGQCVGTQHHVCVYQTLYSMHTGTLYIHLSICINIQYSLSHFVLRLPR